ncbi:uncharacterized protein CG4449 isoform X2 [Drosophila mojavensis]|uniref:Uncharacterized protein, isoform B n=1 Tax=Drosophila mojavensis TaxID=7230 RepID=A0A0Q9X205_DROMO|nr:uncharacterized protein CG4449 isoform X2 [Drosophila mojavensis]KRG02080.1 uncharacterized protein Dmoj_GI10504, isoform B [Drosophila mojavensis]
MSDDDCDIFNMPVKRLNVPQKQFAEECETIKQIDYDFIKKPATKPAKPTIKPNPKPQSGKRKKQAKEEEPPMNKTDEITGITLEEAQASITRVDLSPVSQLIHEMEQKKEREKNKEIEALPVARRTRSSLGKRQTTPEKNKDELETAVLPAVVAVDPPNKRRGRGRGRGKKASAQNADTSSSTAPTNIFEPPRRNRRQAAEVAAYSRVVDSIDLVSAVAPRVEGFINLDSDEDKEMSPTEHEEHAEAAPNFDDDNPVIDINLNWLGDMQVYKLRQHQKFVHMFKEVSKRNEVPVDEVVINMDDVFLNAMDSPQSIGLRGFHILSGRAMKSHKSQQREEVNLMSKPKKFQLKIQNDKWKEPLIIPMKKTETFKILYIKCAEHLECDVQDFKLFFDGDLLEPDDTPKDQEMEGNEIIDYRSK